MKIIKDRIFYSIAASVMFFFNAHLHFLFVNQLIHNVPSPIDVWNWSRRFPNSEDVAHARLHNHGQQSVQIYGPRALQRWWQLCSGTVCETNLVNAVLTSFVDQLIHNVRSPIDVWNWSRRFPNSEDDAHARLHISIKIPVCEDDGLATATPK